jgi:putative membrane protein
MFRRLARIVVAWVGNSVALALAGEWVSGFSLAGGIYAIALTALFLMVLNWTVKPLLTLLLGPVIIFTLGLALIGINMIILYFLDFLSQSLTIQTIPALFFGALFVSFVNAVFHTALRRDP